MAYIAGNEKSSHSERRTTLFWKRLLQTEINRDVDAKLHLKQSAKPAISVKPSSTF